MTTRDEPAAAPPTGTTGTSAPGAAATATGRVRLPPALYDVEIEVAGRTAIGRTRDLTFAMRLRNLLAVTVYGALVTHLPSNAIRVAFLRLCGVRVGPRVHVGRGTQVLTPDHLILEGDARIGQSCLLDARGGLTIGRNVVIEDEVQFLPGGHDVNHPDFPPLPFPERVPTLVDDYVWVRQRAMVMPSYIHRGAVIGPMATVLKDVDELQIVSGQPARPVGTRAPDALAYRVGRRRLLG